MFAYATRSFALTASALAIMAAAAIASPAHAADAGKQSTKIHYRDLDLTTDAGAAALKRRIAHAAARGLRTGRWPHARRHGPLQTPAATMPSPAHRPK